MAELLKEAGATCFQFDERGLVMDLDSHNLHAFTHAYSELESTISGLKECYHEDILC